MLLLDVDPEHLATRMHGRDLDRFEQESDAFHQRVIDGFHRMAAADPDRWVVLDGNGTPTEVEAAIHAVVRERWGWFA